MIDQRFLDGDGAGAFKRRRLAVVQGHRAFLGLDEKVGMRDGERLEGLRDLAGAFQQHRVDFGQGAVGAPTLGAVGARNRQLQRREIPVDVRNLAAGDDGERKIEVLRRLIEFAASSDGTLIASGVSAISTRVPSKSVNRAMRGVTSPQSEQHRSCRGAFVAMGFPNATPRRPKRFGLSGPPHASHAARGTALRPAGCPACPWRTDSWRTDRRRRP